MTESALAVSRLERDRQDEEQDGQSVGQDDPQGPLNAHVQDVHPPTLADLAAPSVSGKQPAHLRSAPKAPDLASDNSASSKDPAASDGRLFAAFLTQEGATRKAQRARRWLFLFSLGVHAIVLTVGVARSFWTVEELSSPRVPITFISLPLAPPPPPPPVARPAPEAPSALAKLQRSRPLEPQTVTVPVPPSPQVVPTSEPEVSTAAADDVVDPAEGGVAGGATNTVFASVAPLAARPPGLSPDERRRLLDRYLEQILRPHINTRFTFPPEAERLGLEGTVVIEVAIDPSGRLTAVRTVGGCPHEILCEAALGLVRESAPFPAPPVALGDVRAQLPLIYQLR